MIVPITFVLLTSMVAIGSWLKVKKNTENENANSYFLAGRGLSGIIIASSLILTNLSTEQLVGLNAQSYDPYGVGGMCCLNLSFGCPLFVTSLPKWWV